MNVASSTSTVSLNISSKPDIAVDFQRRLERFARRRLGDAASAEDAVQATMEALLIAKVPFRGDSSYQTYATGILRHKIGDVLNERRRYVSLADSDQPEDEQLTHHHNMACDSFTDPERHAHSMALGLAIQQSLASLSPRSRQTFLMRERLGLDGDEIAAQMGLSVNHTWVLLCRAKQQLRNSLSGQGYAPYHIQRQNA